MNTYNIKENLLEQLDFIESSNSTFKFTQSKKTTENILNFASPISRGTAEEYLSLLNLVNNKINFREEISNYNIVFLFSTIISLLLFSISIKTYGILLLIFIPFTFLDPRVRSLHSLKLLKEKLESPESIKEINSTGEKKFKNLYLTEKKKVNYLRQEIVVKDNLIKQSISTSIKDKEFIKDLHSDIKKIKDNSEVINNDIAKAIEEIFNNSMKDFENDFLRPLEKHLNSFINKPDNYFENVDDAIVDRLGRKLLLKEKMIILINYGILDYVHEFCGKCNRKTSRFLGGILGYPSGAVNNIIRDHYDYSNKSEIKEPSEKDEMSKKLIKRFESLYINNSKDL